MSSNDWIPKQIDMETLSAARVYDYILGGHHNFEVDRQAARHLYETWPNLEESIRVNRAFLQRATAFFLDTGIDQFVDVGSGIPTVGHVHELALEANPQSKIVYVDIDPVAVAHSRAILRETPNALVIQADARTPEKIFDDTDFRHLIDLSRPVAVYLLTLIHFVVDVDEAKEMLRYIHDVLVPGSYIAVTHATVDHSTQETRERMESLYADSPNPFTYRSKDEISALFEGLNLELVDPGLVLTPNWRPDSPDDMLLKAPERAGAYAGVWRKL